MLAIVSGGDSGRLTRALVVAVAVAAAAAAPAPAQDGTQRPETEPLEELWSEYPLNPGRPEQPLPNTAGTGTRDVPSSPPRQREAPAAADRPSEDALGAGVIAAAFGVLVAAALAAYLVVARVRGVDLAPVPREGGSPMGDVLRRLRAHRAEPGGVEEALAPEQTPPTTTELLTRYTMGRSNDVSKQPDDRDVTTAEPRTGPSGDNDNALAQVGGQVTEVLTAAQRAAEQIRADAEREAETTRAEADAYSTETRRSAEAFAADLRREAETYAAARRAEADETSRAIREAAEREAAERYADAGRRAKELEAEAVQFEERLANLHVVFEGMTRQLEELLSRDQEAADAAPARDAEEGVEQPVTAR